MNKLIPLLAFLVLLLVPVAAQNAFGYFPPICADGIYNSFQNLCEVSIPPTNCPIGVYNIDTNQCDNPESIIDPFCPFPPVATDPFFNTVTDKCTWKIVTPFSTIPFSSDPLCPSSPGIPNHTYNTSSNKCVRSASTTGPGCPSGTTNGSGSSSGQCIVSTSEPICTDGTLNTITDLCEAPTTCGPGTSLIGFQCLPDQGQGGFNCGPNTFESGGLCLPNLNAICGAGTFISGMQCIAQAMGAVGGMILEIDTWALFVANIGVNPVITGLVGITLAGVAGQAVWFVHNRRKKSENDLQYD